MNKDGETGLVSATAENAPANANLWISSVDSSVIDLVESSRIKNKTTGKTEAYDVWFGVDISLGVMPSNSVTITLQSQKLASLPDGALLYHVNPQTNKVRKTAYTYSKAEGKISFKSRDFSPFVILVKRGSAGSAAKDIKDAAANNNLEGGSGVPTYYPAGDNGSGFGGYNGTGAHMTVGVNDTSVFGGMNDTNVTGVNGTKVAGFNDTKFAGENGTNTTNTTMAANVTDEGNTTGANKTDAKEKESGSSGNNSSGGISTGAVIGIIAAIIAAAAAAFGIFRYLKTGRKNEE